MITDILEYLIMGLFILIWFKLPSKKAGEHVVSLTGDEFNKISIALYAAANGHYTCNECTYPVDTAKTALDIWIEKTWVP